MRRYLLSAMSSLGLLVSAQALGSNVDYSKCASFLTPENNTIMPGMMGGGGSRSGLGFMGYLPFTLKDDGKIEAHSDASYSFDEQNNIETITYQVPDYMAPRGENPFKTPMKDINVTIERDSNGQIIRMTNDLNLSQQEVERINRFVIPGGGGSYDPIPVEQEETENAINEVEQWTNPNFTLPMYAYESSSLDFEVVDGECRPVAKTDSFLTEPDVENGRRDTHTDYNLNLCRDIDQFMEENPDAAACFKRDLNQKMNNIFSNYYEPDSSSFGAGLGGGVGGGGIGMGMPGVGIGMIIGANSLEAKLGGHVMASEGGFADTEFFDQMKKRTGQSEIITAHSILQGCYDRGLADFLSGDGPSMSPPSYFGGFGGDEPQGGSSSER